LKDRRIPTCLKSIAIMTISNSLLVAVAKKKEDMTVWSEYYG
jgi:hypothetical protein